MAPPVGMSVPLKVAEAVCPGFKVTIGGVVAPVRTPPMPLSCCTACATWAPWAVRATTLGYPVKVQATLPTLVNPNT